MSTHDSHPRSEPWSHPAVAGAGEQPAVAVGVADPAAAPDPAEVVG